MAIKIWSKEKCARCRTKPAKKELEGLPTCATCEALLLAERETKMPCPACRVNMEKQLVKLVVIDKCPECGGVWLDAGELEQVRKVTQAPGNDHFATGFLLGMAIG